MPVARDSSHSPSSRCVSIRYQTAFRNAADPRSPEASSAKVPQAVCDGVLGPGANLSVA